MKSYLKTVIILAALATSMAACKGGFTGEKQDSTMLDREAMDSTSALNSKAGTMAHDSNMAAKQDTNGLDTSASRQTP